MPLGDAARRQPSSQFDRPWTPNVFRNVSPDERRLPRCWRALARARSCSPPRWRSRRRALIAIRARRPRSPASSALSCAGSTIRHPRSAPISWAPARVSRISVTKPALPQDDRRRRQGRRRRGHADPHRPRGHRSREMHDRAEWRARLRGRGQYHLQDQGLRIRQERRHDHRRNLPGAGLYIRPQQWRGLPHRDLCLSRSLPIEFSSRP
jgi:hypothetical protein